MYLPGGHYLPVKNDWEQTKYADSGTIDDPGVPRN